MGLVNIILNGFNINPFKTIIKETIIKNNPSNADSSIAGFFASHIHGRYQVATTAFGKKGAISLMPFIFSGLMPKSKAEPAACRF